MDLWRPIGDRVAALVLQRPKVEAERSSQVTLDDFEAPDLSVADDQWRQKRHWDD